jgi:hypothetical protein
MLVLHVRSIPELLAPWLPAPNATLVGVVSRWAPFLSFAKTLLVAAGFDADALILRDASQAGWIYGLEQARAVICDSHTASLLPAAMPRITFRLLAEAAIAELQKMIRDAPAASSARDTPPACDTPETVTTAPPASSPATQTRLHETTPLHLSAAVSSLAHL